MFSEIFKYKSVNFDKLKEFGFEERAKVFVFVKDILNGDFSLEICVDGTGNVTSQVFDKGSGEEYGLYLLPEAEGKFVGQVREEVRCALQEICDKCFENDVFKSRQAKTILNFVDKNYGDKLEFLWEKFPDVAILRRKDNKKWYAVLFVLSKSKLKANSDEIVDIIDLRIKPEELPRLVNDKNIFEGYHMNKKHWISLCLDGSIQTKKILNFVENSYKLAKK